MHQTKYIEKIIKKPDMVSTKVLSTPIATNTRMNYNPEGKQVDPKLYRSVISSLLYHTANRSNILFAINMHIRLLLRRS